MDCVECFVTSTRTSVDIVPSDDQSCARVMTVESRVESRVSRAKSSHESLLFPGAESRVISLESESSRVIAKVSRVIIAQLVMSS